MAQQSPFRPKMHHIMSYDSPVRNQNLSQVLSKYVAKKIKNQTLHERAENHQARSYQKFVTCQSSYDQKGQQIQSRIQQYKTKQLKSLRQESTLHEKRRDEVKSKKVDLEEKYEKDRSLVFEREREKLERSTILHHSKISNSNHSRSHSNTQSSNTIRRNQLQLEAHVSSHFMKLSLQKLERTNNYLQQRDLVQLHNRGKKDIEVAQVQRRGGNIQQQRLNRLIHKYMTVRTDVSRDSPGQNRLENTHQAQLTKLQKEKSQRARSKKQQMVQQKQNHIALQHEASLGRLRQVEENRKKQQSVLQKHIEDNRAKIQTILQRNQEVKKKEREHKEELLEIHRQKIEDIERFQSQFQRIKASIPTFITS